MNTEYDNPPTAAKNGISFAQSLTEKETQHKTFTKLANTIIYFSQMNYSNSYNTYSVYTLLQSE